MQQKSNEALLVQHSNGISCFDLIKTKSKRETTGQLFDSTKRRGGAIKPVAQLWQHFIEQLEEKNAHTEQDTQNTLDQESLGSKTKKTYQWLNYWVKEWLSVYTDLLQTENKCLCTLNLVNLPGFTHGLLDDVTIIVVILQKKKKHDRDMKKCLLCL